MMRSWNEQLDVRGGWSGILTAVRDTIGLKTHPPEI